DLAIEAFSTDYGRWLLRGARFLRARALTTSALSVTPAIARCQLVVAPACRRAQSAKETDMKTRFIVATAVAAWFGGKAGAQEFVYPHFWTWIDQPATAANATYMSEMSNVHVENLADLDDPVLLGQHAAQQTATQVIAEIADGRLPEGHGPRIRLFGFG